MSRTVLLAATALSIVAALVLGIAIAPLLNVGEQPSTTLTGAVGGALPGEELGTRGTVHSPAYVEWGFGNRSVISVVGEGVATVEPDRVRISIAIETAELAKSPEEAYSYVVTRAKKVIEALKSLEGVVSITTSGVTLAPRYRWKEGSQQLLGYYASYALTVVTDIDTAGKAVATAVDLGNATVKGVYLEASPDRLRKARLEALEAAAVNAREKAEVVAKALGMALGRPISVSVGYAVTPIPVRYTTAKTPEYGGSQPLPVETGEGIKVRATVTVVFELVG